MKVAFMGVSSGLVAAARRAGAAVAHERRLPPAEDGPPMIDAAPLAIKPRRGAAQWLVRPRQPE
jgi:hypothetical protein